MNLDKLKIGVIGLGYVGLPLAVEFGKKFWTIGYDINKKRVDELNAGVDNTLEVESENLKSAQHLTLSSDASSIKDCNFYIITVPTPIDSNKKPNLRPLESSSTHVGQNLKKGDIVVYESTVYPGCTEEVCVPILEKESGLIFNQDFFCGYSPERINPGDKKHTVTKIKKVTSGSTPEIGQFINEVYLQVITAGTYLAPSMKVAEAAKVIENCQRDVNISFMNELALLFDKLEIDTNEVLEAARSKWNFLPFTPGLVGGHCISVDPYYLTFKAESIGYYPEVILSGRRINDAMGKFVAHKVIKLMIAEGHAIKNSNILILGITFKENTPDIRNSKVIDIYNELIEFGAQVSIYDPWANKEEVKHEFNINLLENINNKFDAIILAVGHKEFETLEIDDYKKSGTIVYDVKGKLDKSKVHARL